MFDPQKIRQAREEAGLTQAELARLLGKKSQDTIRGYESGRIEPPGHVVAQIAAITGKPRVWFVADQADEQPGVADVRTPAAPVTSYDPDEPPMPPGLQRLIDLGVPLRQDELETLLAYADPLNPTRGARGAMAWTPGQWLDMLIEERRRAGRFGS